jgi:hypothetical protein
MRVRTSCLRIEMQWLCIDVLTDIRLFGFLFVRDNLHALQ